MNEPQLGIQGGGDLVPYFEKWIKTPAGSKLVKWCGYNQSHEIFRAGFECCEDNMALKTNSGTVD